MDGTQFIQWAVGQGVAVVVLAFVLLRLDARMEQLQQSVDRLLAALSGHLGVRD